ncbi:MAG: filamentous hemagglutinin, partial [Methylococcaceae bacterium]|nr:filamentous hemagglutinin [Methylococcaceae bacterium]
MHAVDFIQTGVNQSQVTTQSIASPGGNINLTAAEGIIAQGRINTQGGDSAAGGKLAVELNSGLRNKPDIAVAGGEFPDDDNPAKPRTLEISQYPGSLLTDFSPWLSPIPAQFNGRGSFNAVQLNASGAAELAFKVDATAANQFVGSILFDGDQTLHAQRSIVLDAPSFKTLNGANVILNSNYAVLGSSKSRLDNALGDGQFSTRLAPDAWSGQGTLKVNANAIDLTGGLSFNGFNQVDLNSQGDVRTIGIRQIRDTKDFLGELHLSGNLNITATQIYPTTLSDYTITINGNSNNAVTFLRNSSAISPVLSAAGQLTVNAPNIVQQGVLKAPFGQLSLNAQNNLSLASGSLTSVSSDGQTIPFGQVSGGLNWLYPLDASATINLLINTPPEKRLTLTGRDVALNQGAVVDLQGGGDLYAYEFVPGPGGSKDVLDATSAGYQPKFAVMPALANALTPIDPLEFPNAKLKVGDSVYLAAGSDLSAGWYTLLPAHYALLPGAYLVTPQAGSLDMQPEQSYTDYTGAAVVAGRYGVASAGIADSRWQGFTVEPGTIARSQSQFKDYSANTFFANNLASQLPKDAGGLSIDVINTLGLHAELRSAAANDGRGGQVNISADQLAIVGRREELTVNTGSKVVLLADDLNALNAPSILLGGLREQDKRGQRITVSAQSIHISGTAKLQGPEILLAAQSQIQLDSGAQLISQGNTGAAAENLLVSNKSGGSDGAFVRLSDNKQQTVLRDQAVSGNQGELLVASGVRLAAEGSMLLESTQNTVFAGDIAMNSGSLALKSSRISLGDAPTGTQGLVLHNTAFNL